MNIIKRAILGSSAFAALIVGETSSAILRVLDWMMMSTLASDKICAGCGLQNDMISMQQPLCPSCYSIHEYDDECEEDDGQMDRLPHLKKDVMFR